MKYLLLLLVIFSCAIVKDGYNKDPAKLKEYIIDAPGIKKDILFVSANTYVTRKIKGRQETVEYEDKEAGKVIGYLYDIMNIGGQTEIRYKYEIDVKDEKLRCRFSYPQLYIPQNQTIGRGGWHNINAIATYNKIVERWKLIPNEIYALAKKEDNW